MTRSSTYLLALCFTGLPPLFHGHARHVSANDIYRAGDVREYEISVPRLGFYGSVNITSLPDFRPARADEDFEKHFVRIEVLNNRSLSNGKRFVLRIDGNDPEGGETIKGIYYAYVDTSSKGTKVIGRDQDDSVGHDETVCSAQYGLRFPFICSRPPALGFSKSNVDGYFISRVDGVMYARKDKKTLPAVTVEATRFQNLKAFKDGKQEVHWYGADIADLAKVDSGATILFHETQHWEKADDWLWQKMERFNARGDVLMRCVLKKQTDDGLGPK